VLHPLRKDIFDPSLECDIRDERYSRSVRDVPVLRDRDLILCLLTLGRTIRATLIGSSPIKISPDFSMCSFRRSSQEF